MGGKALNKYGVFTERKNTESFKQIGDELKTKLFNDLNLTTEVTKCYRNKVDHGDLDLLVKIEDGINIDIRKYIIDFLKPRAINVNGCVYSFDYLDFQIDIIPIHAQQWNGAITYFSYDPLGNLMGKTFHKFGLSYGWEGLFYKYRNFNGTNSKNILITNDIKRIFEFGGYDYERYLLGFDTIEEIFKFIISGKYFVSEIFKFENLKAIDKKRNRKRGSYHKFLNYIQENQIKGTYEFDRNKENYIQHIFNKFPESDLITKINILKGENALNEKASTKFNGNLVIQWFPNLIGKELGAALTTFKSSIIGDYREYILNNSIEVIRNDFSNTLNV